MCNAAYTEVINGQFTTGKDGVQFQTPGAVIVSLDDFMAALDTPAGLPIRITIEKPIDIHVVEPHRCQEIAGQCERCDEEFCEECLDELAERLYCQPCREHCIQNFNEER